MGRRAWSHQVSAEAPKHNTVYGVEGTYQHSLSDSELYLKSVAKMIGIIDDAKVMKDLVSSL